MEKIYVSAVYCGNDLCLESESRTIGTQFDHKSQTLVFSRPEKHDGDQLILFFENSAQHFEPVNLREENEYVVTSGLTQTQGLTLQVAFERGGEMLQHSNKIYFSLRSSVKRGGGPIEPPPDGVGASQPKSPFIGENGNWQQWDDTAKQYVDTGISAEGAPGKDGRDGLTTTVNGIEQIDGDVKLSAENIPCCGSDVLDVLSRKADRKRENYSGRDVTVQAGKQALASVTLFGGTKQITSARGKNLACFAGTRFVSSRGNFTADCDPKTGIITLNTSAPCTGDNTAFSYFMGVQEGDTYTLSATYLSGSFGGSPAPLLYLEGHTFASSLTGSANTNPRIHPELTLAQGIMPPLSYTVTAADMALGLRGFSVRIYGYNTNTMNNYKFKVQVEKAAAASNWELPTPNMPSADTYGQSPLTGVGEGGALELIAEKTGAPTISNTISIPLDSPLYGLDQNVRDSINLVAGQCVRATQKIVLTGSEAWALQTQNVKFAVFSLPLSNAGGNSTQVNCVSDRFTSCSYSEMSALEKECVSTFEDSSGKGNLAVCILKGRAATMDSAGFKEWLAANRTTVVFQAAPPKEQRVAQYISPIYPGTNRIYTNDPALPELHVAVLDISEPACAADIAYYVPYANDALPGVKTISEAIDLLAARS